MPCVVYTFIRDQPSIVVALQWMEIERRKRNTPKHTKENDLTIGRRMLQLLPLTIYGFFMCDYYEMYCVRVGCFPSACAQQTGSPTMRGATAPLYHRKCTLLRGRF